MALHQEMEKIKREVKAMKKEFDNQLSIKNTKINNLLTELENTKTDLAYSNNKLDSINNMK